MEAKGICDDSGAHLAVVAVAMSATLALPATARAVSVTLELTGAVSEIDDDQDRFGGAFTLGMPFTATIEYDTSLPDTEPRSEIGRYREIPASLISISMSLGGVDITTSTATSDAGALVRSDTPYFSPNVNHPVSTGPSVDQIQMILTSSDPLAITSEALPTSLDLSRFDGNTLMAFASTSSFPYAFVFAEIETLTLELPEPGPALLIGLALGGLLLDRRPRSRGSVRAERRPEVVRGSNQY